MKVILMAFLAVSFLSGCSHFKKGGCCSKDKSECSQQKDCGKGQKECGTECGTEKGKP